jgi:hypothetical protein
VGLNQASLTGLHHHQCQAVYDGALTGDDVMGQVWQPGMEPQLLSKGARFRRRRSIPGSTLKPDRLDDEPLPGCLDSKRAGERDQP